MPALAERKLPRPPPTESWAAILADADSGERSRILADFSENDYEQLEYDWNFWARGKQLVPDDKEWTTWVVLSGRGFGKTRTGAEWFREKAETHPNGRGMLLGMTPRDVRDVMILGPSGLMKICPPWNRPTYEPSNLTLTWPNGYTAAIRSAHNPEAVRGPEQEHAWVDEFAAFPAKAGQLAWENMTFGLRYGEHPQACLTTTPKPVPLLLEILGDENTVISKGSTYENVANLAPTYLSKIIAKHEGTNLGRQEIYAELLGEVEGALWTRAIIEATRVADYPDLVRVVVGVDPSGGVAEIGIIAGGLGVDGQCYILSDATLRGRPDVWGKAALTEYNKFQGDRVVGEANYGGEMVEATIRHAAKALGQHVSYKAVNATRGKRVRAEPIAALYEQGLVHHVGMFPQLEGEMTSWVPGEKSPNRMDAMVWVVTELMPVSKGGRPGIFLP